jgi:hypothetical protein
MSWRVDSSLHQSGFSGGIKHTTKVAATKKELLDTKKHNHIEVNIYIR